MNAPTLPAPCTAADTGCPGPRTQERRAQRTTRSDAQHACQRSTQMCRFDCPKRSLLRSKDRNERVGTAAPGGARQRPQGARDSTRTRRASACSRARAPVHCPHVHPRMCCTDRLPNTAGASGPAMHPRQASRQSLPRLQPSRRLCVPRGFRPPHAVRRSTVRVRRAPARPGASAGRPGCSEGKSDGRAVGLLLDSCSWVSTGQFCFASRRWSAVHSFVAAVCVHVSRVYGSLCSSNHVDIVWPTRGRAVLPSSGRARPSLFCLCLLGRRKGSSEGMLTLRAQSASTRHMHAVRNSTALRHLNSGRQVTMSRHAERAFWRCKRISDLNIAIARASTWHEDAYSQRRCSTPRWLVSPRGAAALSALAGRMATQLHTLNPTCQFPFGRVVEDRADNWAARLHTLLCILFDWPGHQSQAPRAALRQKLRVICISIVYLRRDMYICFHWTLQRRGARQAGSPVLVHGLQLQHNSSTSAITESPHRKLSLRPHKHVCFLANAHPIGCLIQEDTLQARARHMKVRASL